MSSFASRSSIAVASWPTASATGSRKEDLGDVSGRRLSNSPEWSGRLWLEWMTGAGRAGTFSLRADSHWQSTVTGKQVMKATNVPNVLAVMATAGLYDDSGKWLYRTGLPGKSGGGLIAVSPGKFGIAVVSPPLDEPGNSVRAQMAIADVSNALGGNPLASKPR